MIVRAVEVLLIIADRIECKKMSIDTFSKQLHGQSKGINEN